MDIKDIKKLTQFMRHNGVLTLKTKEIELTLHTGALKTEKRGRRPITEDKPLAEEQMDPLETMLWSSPGELNG
jgi:hypothetical protein